MSVRKSGEAEPAVTSNADGIANRLLELTRSLGPMVLTPPAFVLMNRRFIGAWPAVVATAVLFLFKLAFCVFEGWGPTRLPKGMSEAASPCISDRVLHHFDR